MNYFRPEDWVWLGNQLVVIAALLVGLRRRLGHEFRYFLAYLAVSGFVSLLLLYFHTFARNLNVYAQIYKIWGYCVPIFFFLMVSEVLRAALSGFPAVYSASRRLLQMVWLGLAVFGVGWYLYLDRIALVPYPSLKAAIAYQQSSITAFALFILFFLGFVALMPVPLSRLRLRHTLLLGALFIAMACSRLLVLLNDFAWARSLASVVGMLGSASVLVAWAFWVREDQDDSTFHGVSGALTPQQIEQSFQRLQDLDTIIARSGPRFIR